MRNLKEIYASMTDADIEVELRNNKNNLDYCVELWTEQDRRAEYKCMMLEANQT
jgi:hypothetical protein